MAKFLNISRSPQPRVPQQISRQHPPRRRQEHREKSEQNRNKSGDGTANLTLLGDGTANLTLLFAEPGEVGTGDVEDQDQRREEDAGVEIGPHGDERRQEPGELLAAALDLGEEQEQRAEADEGDEVRALDHALLGGEGGGGDGQGAGERGGTG